MKHNPISSDFFVRNRAKVLNEMPNASLLVLYGNPNFYFNPSTHFPFRQLPDFYYLTGINYPDCALIIYKESSDNSTQILAIPEVTEFKRQWDSDLLEESVANTLSGIDSVAFIHNIKDVLLELQNKIELLFVYKLKQNDRHPGIFFHSRKAAFIGRMFPNIKKSGINDIIHKLRMVKEEEEILRIQNAIEITAEALNYCLSKLDKYSTEKQFELDLYNAFLENGADGHAFDPIIASAGNATILHYISNANKIVKGQLLLADIGARIFQYNADITRVVPFVSITSRQKEVFNAVFRVYNSSLNEITLGMTLVDVNKLVASYIQDELLSLGLITQKEICDQKASMPAYRKYYMHSASHFLGLEVHDVGARDLPLQENMVITLEPGIYIKEENIGIRLENDLLITNKGAKELSSEIPMHWEDLMDWAK